MTKNNLRIIFMGTPDFALKSLEALYHEFDIVSVVTAPDKKRGRGQKVIPTPIKKFAEAKSIPVLQPSNLKDPDFINQIEDLNPDLNVVVAFRMLPEKLLSIPAYGSVNLHASLLPDYRGAAPINHAIINGETQTGVTTFFLDRKMDTGNIILQKIVDIQPEDNAGSLHDKLMYTGADLLTETVHKIAEGTAEPVPQPQKSGKKAPKIFKENCKINWYQPGKNTHNFIRGLSPYPAAYTIFQKNTKLLNIKIYNGKFIPAKHNRKVGELIVEKESLFVTLSDGYYEITDLQPQSKKRLNATDFIRGLQPGDELVLNNDVA